MSEVIVIYDGECHLCNKCVSYLLQCDKDNVLQFASSNSEYVRKTYPSISNWSSNGLLVVTDGTILIQSDAVMAICQNVKKLNFAGKFLSLFSRSFRNAMYRFVARNRYRLFGDEKKCYQFSTVYPNRFIR